MRGSKAHEGEGDENGSEGLPGIKASSLALHPRGLEGVVIITSRTSGAL